MSGRARYAAFLKSARTESRDLQKEVESSPDYQKLKQDYETASQGAAPHIKELNEKLRDLTARILAVQNVFTDRRAYVGALTYEIETETSASAKQRKQKDLEKYKQEVTSVIFPDGSKQNYNYRQLEDIYNDLKNQRTLLSVELGEAIKPVNEQKEKVDTYISDHITNLTPSQLAGLQNKTEDWAPAIIQINVPDANIVDRCQSCHMGIREPVKLSPAAMSLKGKKPDEYALAFTSHPEPNLLQIPGAHAHILFLRKRTGQTRAVFSGTFRRSLSAASRGNSDALREGDGDGAQPVHQQRRAVLEMPRHRRSCARSNSDRSQLAASERTLESGLDGALDHRPASDQPGHFHAFRTV